MNNNTGRKISQPLLALDQPLNDKSGSGRKQPWAQRRTEAEILAAAYADIDPSKMDRLLECAPRLIFERAEGDERMRLDTAWFCRVRLCPICQWRRSMKIYGQMAEIVRAANAQSPEKKGYGWIMLTLTVRNVAGQQLSQEITNMAQAWNRLTKMAEWKRAVLGSMRSLEVTHNTDARSQSYDTYHPHLHVLLCVRRSYFNGTDYISQKQWRSMWQAAARLSYSPQVDVRRVGTRDTDAESLIYRIAETTKYVVKPGDYIMPVDYDMMQRTVAVLDKALHKRRLVAWTGNLKEIHAKLQLDDIDNGDLVNTGEDKEAESKRHTYIIYSWLQERRNYYMEVDADAIENKGGGQAAADEIDSNRKVYTEKS